MKFIALRSFVNTRGKIKLDDVQHPDMIHRGAVFDFGPPNTTGTFRQQLEAAAELDLDAAKHISALLLAGSVGDATDTALVSKVQGEVAIDKKREANVEANNYKLLAGAAGLQLLNALADGQKVADSRRK